MVVDGGATAVSGGVGGGEGGGDRAVVGLKLAKLRVVDRFASCRPGITCSKTSTESASVIALLYLLPVDLVDTQSVASARGGTGSHYAAAPSGALLDWDSGLSQYH